MRQRRYAPKTVCPKGGAVGFVEDRHAGRRRRELARSIDLAGKVCYIIVKAREFDAKDVVTDPDDASNPTDDAMVSVLEDHRDDPVVRPGRTSNCF
jgi:hypothetical protein